MFRDDPSVLTRQEEVVAGRAERGISARTQRLYDSVRGTKPRLAVDRARLMTESFARTHGQPMVLRWARALEHIAQHIALYIAPDELIVGRAAGFPGRYVVFYPEVDGAYAAEAVELLAARKEASIAVTDDDKETVKAIGAAWQGKTFTESYVASIPEETRHLFFGADKTNLSKQTFVGMQTATLRNSQNWTHDYAKVLKRGFKGLRAEAEAKLAALDDPAQLAEKAPFLQAVMITCDAIVTFARRYSALAAEMAGRETDAQRRKELEQIAETCAWVPENPARSFREAVQAQWFTQLFSRLEQRCGSALGNSRIDQYLQPYYADITEGRISRDEAIELLRGVWLHMFTATPAGLSMTAAQASSDGYAHFESTTLGGKLRDGRDATCDASYLVLDSARDFPLSYPELAVRIHARTPDRFLHAVCELIKEGKGIPKLLNDEQIIPFFLSRGAGIEEANDYAGSGCVEARLINRETAVTGNAGFNYGSLVEMVLRNGRIKIYGDQKFGLETGDPRTLASYEDFWAAFKAQLEHVVHLIIHQQVLANGLKAGFFAAPLASMLHDLCMDQCRDLHTQSLKGQILMPCLESVGFATAINSLAAVKKLVYDDKSVTMDELLAAIDADFEGHEALRQMCVNAPKYGNSDPEVDRIGWEIEHLIAGLLDRWRHPGGERFTYRCIPVTAHIPFGRVVAATPDGRKAGTYLSEGVTAFHGTDQAGPTAALTSYADATCGDHSVVSARLINQKFSPRSLAGDEGTRLLMGYVRSWCDLKIWHVQFNVIRRETLLAARKDPEKYRDLVIRVAGYSAYFTELSPMLQDEIIARTEHDL